MHCEPKVFLVNITSMLQVSDLDTKVLKTQVEQQSKTIDLLQLQNTHQQSRIIQLTQRLEDMASSVQFQPKSYCIDFDERIDAYVKRVAELEALLQKETERALSLEQQLQILTKQHELLQVTNKQLEQTIDEQQKIILQHPPKKFQNAEKRIRSLEL